jgi:non-homologous end joining protein Ku
MSKRDHKKKVTAYKAKVQQKRETVFNLVEQLEAALEVAKQAQELEANPLHNETPLYITGTKQTK